MSLGSRTETIQRGSIRGVGRRPTHAFEYTLAVQQRRVGAFCERAKVRLELVWVRPGIDHRRLSEVLASQWGLLK